jgi:hypothetical protein
VTSIYFAKCGEHIKIGIAGNVKQRIGSLQVASAQPIELIGAVKGTAHDERRLHKTLSRHRIKGEWFSDCPEVRSAMNIAIERGDWSDPIVSAKAKSDVFGKVCKAIWPFKTAEELASRVGCSVRAAAYEISGEREPSVHSLQAVINAMIPQRG